LRWFEGRGWREHATSEQIGVMNSPVGSVASRSLGRRRRRVRRCSKGFGRQTARDRHRLRIAVKSLRYTIELFGSLYDRDDSQKFVSRLKRLQDDLGYASDVRAAHEFVPELFASTEPLSPAGHAWVALLEWHNHALVRGERKLRRRVRQLNDATAFWRK